MKRVLLFPRLVWVWPLIVQLVLLVGGPLSPVVIRAANPPAEDTDDDDGKDDDEEEDEDEEDKDDEDDDDDCECPPCEDCGSEEGEADSVSYALSLGRVTTVKDGVEKAAAFKFALHEQEVRALLYARPSLAKVGAGQPKGAELIGDNGSTSSSAPVRQIVTQEALADLQPASGGSGYTLKLYARSQVGAKSGGVYAVSGAPVKTIVFRNPDGAASGNRFEVYSSDAIGAVPVTKTLRWSKTVDAANASAVQWKLEQFSGDAQQAGAALVKRTVLHRMELGGSERTYTQTRTVETIGSGGSLALVQKQAEKFAYYTGTKPVLLERRENPDGPNPVVTTRSYFTNSSDPVTYGKVQAVRTSGGAWKDYSYARTSAGYLATTVASGRAGSPVGNAALGKVVTKTVDAQNQAFSSREVKVAGRVVQSVQIAPAASGGGTVKTTMRAVSGGGSTSGMVAKTATFAPKAATGGSGVAAGRVSSIAYADGRVAKYSYSNSGSGSSALVVRTKEKGVATAQGSVSSGVRTIVKLSSAGAAREEVRTDIATGVRLYAKAADPATLDVMGRAQKFVYNEDPKDYELEQRGCCGVEFKRERDGKETTTIYDVLQRPKTIITRYPGQPEQTLNITYNGLTETQILTTNGQSRLVKETTRDLAGQIVSLKTPDCNGDGTPETTTYARATTGGFRRVTETRPDGGQVITETYADGKTKSITGSAVADVAYEYGSDAEGDFTKEIRLSATGDQSEWIKTYRDPEDHNIKEVNASGAVRTWEYEDDELKKTVDADGVTTLYRYNGEGKLTLTAIDMNRNGQIDFAGPDRIVENVITSVTDPVLGACTKTITQVYPEDGSATPKVVATKLESTAGLGERTESFGRTTTVARTKPVNGAWNITTIYSDNTSKLEEYTNGRLFQTTFKDNAGAQVARTTLAYDSFGRVKSSTDARTGTTDFESYPDGSLWKVISPHKSNGTARDTIIFARDGLGRETAVTLPDGSVTRTSYYPTGKIRKRWGSQTYPQRYEYDEQGRMAKLVTFQAILDNREPGDTEAGQETKWHYEPASGVLARKEYADGKGPGYTYTAAGRLLTRTWARRVNGAPLVTTYGYNNAGAVSNVDYSDSTPDVAIIHDRLGRLKSMTDGTGTTQYAYRVSDLQLERETLNGLLNKTLERGYDSLGRPSGQKVGDYSGSAFTVLDHCVGYEYDAAGRIGSVIHAAGTPEAKTFAYTYVPNSAGLIATMTGPVHTVTNTYEPDRDVLKLKENKVGATIVSSFDYVVNALGQRTAVSYAGSAFEQPNSFNLYGYNNTGELTSATKYAAGTPTVPQSPLTDRDYSYSYDGIGNRTTARPGGTSVVTTYSPNQLNQYSEVTDRSGTYPLTYDEDGNLTSDGEAIYSWDAENRLTKIDKGATEATLIYDGYNRRIRKHTESAEGTVFDHAYLYSGWNVLAEYNTKIGSSPIVLAVNTWGLDVSGTLNHAGGVGGLVARTQDENTYSYAFDGNGNVSDVLDLTGERAAHHQYNSYGKIIVQSGSAASRNPWRFSTKHQDDSDIIYFGYRYYHSGRGTWLSRDPIAENGGLNLYGYVGNAPHARVDPFGLFDPGGRTFAELARIAATRAAVAGGATAAADSPAPGPADLAGVAVGVGTFIGTLIGEAIAEPVADLIYPDTAPQNSSDWDRAREDYWKRRAANAEEGEFSEEDLERMRRGKPPLDPETGACKELHHKKPQREGGTHDDDNLEEVWPWEHEAVDPYRHYRGPRPPGVP